MVTDQGVTESDMTEQVSMGALCFSEEEREAYEGKDRPETTNTGEQHPERITRRRARTPGCGHTGMSRQRWAFLVGAPRGHPKVGRARKQRWELAVRDGVSVRITTDVGGMGEREGRSEKLRQVWQEMEKGDQRPCPSCLHSPAACQPGTWPRAQTLPACPGDC